MKRSEFIKRFQARCLKGRHGELVNLKHALAGAEEVMRESGTWWDPEEPELPSRVGVASTRNPVLWSEEGLHQQFEQSELVGRIAREAAACYNAVGRFLGYLRDQDRAGLRARLPGVRDGAPTDRRPHGDTPFAYLKELERMLDLERERLR